MWHSFFTRRLAGYIPVLLILLLAAYLRINHISQPNRYIFDEDYFAFTASLIAQQQPLAYEYWHPAFSQLKSEYLYRPPAVEWLHPPLSKLLIGLAIKLGGNTPAAWRFMPALFGVFTVILVMLLMRLFRPNSAYLVWLAGFLAAIEPMLVTESRLAGANMILTFFTTLSVYIFLVGLKRFLAKNTSPKSKNYFSYLFAILLGASLGLAAATKWSGIYLVFGLGLGGLFFIFKSNIFNSRQKVFRSIFVTSIIFWILPLVIYLLSYTQFFSLNHFSLTKFTQLQAAMWHYQTTTTEAHPFQSRAWQWPLGQVPIPYFINSQSSNPSITLKSSYYLITFGFIAFFYTVFKEIKLRVSQNRKPKFLLFKFIQTRIQHTQKHLSSHHQQSLMELALIIATLSLWLPWFLVGRNTFLYHAVPLLPLLIVFLCIRVDDLIRSRN